MATPTTPMVPAASPPYQQFQSFYPPVDNAELLAHLANQTQHINQNIYQSTDKVTAGINSTSQYLTGGLNNVGKEVTQSALGLRDAIERGNLNHDAAIQSTGQYLSGGLNNVGKEVTQSALGLRDAIERGNLVNGSAIERTTGEIKLNTAIQDAASRQAAADSARDILRAVDANGSMNNATMERIGLTVGHAVERNANMNGMAIERTAGNISSAIEKVAGEGRLTTTVTDAASRQAAADSARDITRSVEHNGSAITSAVERNGAQNHSATQAIGTTLLSTIERVAGEGRVTTTVTDAASRQAAADSARDITRAVEHNSSAMLSAVERNGGDTRMALSTANNLTNNLLTDVRHAIIGEVNRGTDAGLMANTQSLNTITRSVTDSAWENRVGLQAATIEQLKSTAALQQQSSQHYASTLLEGQKSTALLSLDGANHYASLVMEQQKLKEYLSNKGDSHFAMNQLEMHKVKEGLAAQAAHNFSALQLDQHKIKESIQAQLADAKYDALKNTQFLADKLCECCCEVKQKIDLVDRDRLRDNLINSRDENSLLRVAEFLDRRDDRRGHRHWDDRRGDDRRGDDRR